MNRDIIIIIMQPASNGNRHKFHQVKRPNILNDTITRIQLTPNLSSLAPFQSDLCTENGIIAVMFLRKEKKEEEFSVFDPRNFFTKN